jgi:hypothetical protein
LIFSSAHPFYGFSKDKIPVSYSVLFEVRVWITGPFIDSQTSVFGEDDLGLMCTSCAIKIKVAKFQDFTLVKKCEVLN